MLLPALAFSKTAPSLEITGNASEAVTHNIQALIDLSRYPCHPPQAQYGLIRRQIIANSTGALQAMGYYDSQLNLSTDENSNCVSFTLDVNTGPPVILTHLKVEITGDAAQDPAFSTLLEKTQLAIGQRLQHDRYSNLKKSLQQHLISRGYVQGELTVHTLSLIHI